MGLLDHFRSPPNLSWRWDVMHAAWANSIMASLNSGLLPRFYLAQAEVHIGGRIEVDVGTFEDRPDEEAGGGTATATAALAWVASPPLATLPMVFPDALEILVYANEGGAILAAAIELVSPSNKDRPESRRAFVAKCAGYLQQGAGLVIVDVVTDRQANLHEELSAFLGGLRPPPKTSPPLYAAAYRPMRLEADERVDVWDSPLALGDPLPTMPLALRRGPTLPLDLDAPYREARLRCGVRD